MQLVTFILNTELNISVQVGDMLYYAPLTQPGVASDAFLVGDISNVIQFGEITDVSPGAVSVMWDDSDSNNSGVPDIPMPTDSDFLMFGKDGRVNAPGLKGYYADVKFVNNSTKKIELFSIGSQVIETSK